MRALQFAESEARNAAERQAILRAEIPDLEKSAKAASDKTQKALAEKKKKLRDLMQESKELQQRYSEVQQRTKEIRERETEARRTLDVRCKELEDSRSAVTGVKSQLASLQEEGLALRTIIEAEKERALKGSEKTAVDKGSLRTALKELKAKEVEKKREIDFANDRIGYARRDLESREAEIKTASSDKDRASVSILEQELASLQQENASLSRQLEARIEASRHYSASSQFTQD